MLFRRNIVSLETFVTLIKISITMKKKSIVLFCCCLFFAGIQMMQAADVKIACIGNSITYGHAIANREKNSYPAQLQSYLGDKYEVRNFGASGSILLHKGDYPYILTKEYKESLEFCPDIVFIKLGTNDSKPQNICYVADFKKEYLQLIHSYQQLPSKPRVILLTPIRCFLKGEENPISDKIIQTQLIPIIQEIAYEEKLEIIDMYHLFGDQWDFAVLPDKLHPSSIGAGIMAKCMYECLSAPRGETPDMDFAHSESFNFHGFQGYDFKYEGNPCKIVFPKQPAKGNPWVIRARFWGHEPQTDVALLERGFCITYCDVSDLFGSDKAVKRWNRFYKLMTRKGLSRKVVLEGMSRGGLIVYNWAARNPDKVACIYADAPVMDVKSWPLGMYSGSNRSEGDAQQLTKAYGLSEESKIKNWKRNPIDHAKTLAKAKIPMLHVVGDADEVVPVKENTAVFADRLGKYGYQLSVIHKPGVGHHPHSLNDPSDIVRFILRATGHSENMCAHPVSGNEFRSAAGWKEGSEWHTVAEDITATLTGKQMDLLLLGNSITQGFGGNRNLVTYKPGKAAADEIFKEKQWETAGISGDRTQNLLWRVQHGNYAVCNPKNVVITIGINNLVGGRDEPSEVTEGIAVIALECRKQFPEARILLMGLLPSGAEKNDPIRIKCDEIHRQLAKTKWEGIEYINPTAWFINDNGSLKTELYAGDNLHLNEQGYVVWCTHLKNKLFN